MKYKELWVLVIVLSGVTIMSLSTLIYALIKLNGF